MVNKSPTEKNYFFVTGVVTSSPVVKVFGIFANGSATLSLVGAEHAISDGCDRFLGNERTTTVARRFALRDLRIDERVLAAL